MKRLLLIAICFIMFFVCGCNSTPTIVVIEATSSQAPIQTPVKTTAPVPTPTPIPEPTQVNVLVTGDAMCLHAQLSAARTNDGYEFDHCFSKIKPKVSVADLAIANLETLVAQGYAFTGPAPMKEVIIPSEDPNATPIPTTVSGNTKINAPDSFLSAVIDCGFDVLTNANNHIYDLKADGIVLTNQKLDEYGVYHTGTYATEEDKTPLIVEVKGVHIAVIAYTDILNNRPGSSNKFMINTYDIDSITTDIAAAKEAGADYIIVSVHWGIEHTHNQNRSQKRMAEEIAQAGANIIMGSHSHCTQPFDTIETDHGSVPVIYSLGNLISSMAKTMHKDGVMINLVLEKEYETNTTSLVQLTYTPTLCTHTDTDRFVILPADLASIAQSDMAATLEDSRERTIAVLSDTVATPE